MRHGDLGVAPLADAVRVGVDGEQAAGRVGVAGQVVVEILS
ncbi:MAG: hypothetical protein ABIT71_14555 [Vicinamibacteraceae bacterium]